MVIVAEAMVIIEAAEADLLVTVLQEAVLRLIVVVVTDLQIREVLDLLLVDKSTI